MCRLFGLASPQPITATFWLLDAPDSLLDQSRRNPDGTGLGCFDEHGHAVVRRAPIPAYRDRAFAREARAERSTDFVAHVRFASTGALTLANTHPFVQDGRLFAHNGVVQGLHRLEQRLAQLGVADLVGGDTDSERLFALITAETRRADGDVEAGIERALPWVAAELPLFAVNFVLIAPGQLWALRYPETHDLLMLERRAGGHRGDRALEHRSSLSRVHSEDLSSSHAVVVATERLDDDPGWRPLRSGELLHAGPDARPESRVVLDAPPAHLLTLDDLDEHARASQAKAPA